MTEQERNAALVARYKAGDQEAGNELITANEGLVRAIAKRNAVRMGLARRDPLNDDVLQEARLGILCALQTYDPTQSQFTTFATPWIMRQVWSFLRSELGTIRVPYVRKTGTDSLALANAVRGKRAAGGTLNNIDKMFAEPSDMLEIAEEKTNQLRQTVNAMRYLNKSQQKRIQAFLNGNGKAPARVSRKIWKKGMACSVKTMREVLAVRGDMPEVKW